MDEKTIQRIILVIVLGISVVMFSRGCHHGRVGNDAEYRTEVEGAKREFTSDHQVATTGVSKSESYNFQLEADQREANQLLRELEQRLDYTIKERAQEIKRK